LRADAGGSSERPGSEPEQITAVEVKRPARAIDRHGDISPSKAPGGRFRLMIEHQNIEHTGQSHSQARSL